MNEKERKDEFEEAVDEPTVDGEEVELEAEADANAVEPEVEAEAEEEVAETDEAEAVEPEAEKMLTQSQVNELVGRARQEGRESALRELYSRYGVSGETELGDIFGRGQAYYDLDDEFKAQGENYRSVLAENALLKSRADESRWDDIKLILGGKGLDVTMENIESLIPSHPEWRAGAQTQQMAQPPQQAPQPQMVTQEVADEIKGQMSPERVPDTRATLRKLGGEATPAVETNPEESEEEKVRRLYGL